MPPAEEAVEGFVDLAALGWRLLRAPVTKHKDDRWGSEGISVRCLARIALATDVLMERPKHARPQGRNRSRAGGFADEVRIAQLAPVAFLQHLTWLSRCSPSRAPKRSASADAMPSRRAPTSRCNPRR